MLFWIGFFLGVGCVTYYLSRLQPFPEISGRFAGLVLVFALILWISSTSPRQGSDQLPAVLSVVVGGPAVVFGVVNMEVTKQDVILAPIGGVLFCVGGVSLLAGRWEDSGQAEQIGSFILASTIVLLEIYLVFRGLVIGVPGITWSKSGLRQIHRGLIHGPNGAISHFERSWDMEDPWINSMSHAALVLLHRELENSDDEKSHLRELEKEGGWDSVDSSWTEAIESALSKLAL
jgi:hypothetical protein